MVNFNFIIDHYPMSLMILIEGTWKSLIKSMVGKNYHTYRRNYFQESLTVESTHSDSWEFSDIITTVNILLDQLLYYFKWSPLRLFSCLQTNLLMFFMGLTVIIWNYWLQACSIVTKKYELLWLIQSGKHPKIFEWIWRKVNNMRIKQCSLFILLQGLHSFKIYTFYPYLFMSFYLLLMAILLVW